MCVCEHKDVRNTKRSLLMAFVRKKTRQPKAAMRVRVLLLLLRGVSVQGPCTPSAQRAPEGFRPPLGTAICGEPVRMRGDCSSSPRPLAPARCERAATRLTTHHGSTLPGKWRREWQLHRKRQQPVQQQQQTSSSPMARQWHCECRARNARNKRRCHACGTKRAHGQIQRPDVARLDEVVTALVGIEDPEIASIREAKVRERDGVQEQLRALASRSRRGLRSPSPPRSPTRSCLRPSPRVLSQEDRPSSAASGTPRQQHAVHFVHLTSLASASPNASNCRRAVLPMTSSGRLLKSMILATRARKHVISYAFLPFGTRLRQDILPSRAHVASRLTLTFNRHNLHRIITLQPNRV